MEWYQKDEATLVQELETDAKQGLTDVKAQEALQKHGRNELEEGKKKTFAEKLLEQFKDPLIIILIIAAILSGVIGEIIDSIIIMAIVILNSGLSLYQEGKAEEAIEALQKMASPEAKVIRGGQVKIVKSAEVVPGDLIELETGDIVPADLRLIESSNLKIDESSLTGESVAVDKDARIVYSDIMEIGDRENTAYSSTIVTYGRGRGIVVETGTGTEIGKIATTISSYEEEETPLQKKLNELSKLLGILVIVVCVIVFVLGLFRDMELLHLFMTAVSLAVAAIPEGMAAIVTIVLSLGMNRMAKKNAIVKKLLAVETLGTTTVICSDKTGTLTQNEMTVTKAYVDGTIVDVSGTGYEPVGKLEIEGKEVEDGQLGSLYTLLNIAALTNDAAIVEENGLYKCMGDPTEGALLTLAGKKDLTKEGQTEKYPRIDEIPFDSSRKMMTTFHSNFIEGKVVSFTKGAPDIIIDRCTKVLINGKVEDFTPERVQKALETNSTLAKQALRCLAYSFRVHDALPEQKDKTSENIEKELIFVGLTGMIDPPRPEVRAAITECKEAGIQVKMITGDYLETAFAIGKDLGISSDPSEAIMGRELNEMNDEQLRNAVKTKNIFARVSPENKVQIVTALKENGHIAAMTGDGVNDAPAIKKADIGIAMGITGTDVAKNTAEVILTDDNFATIVNAVEEGRIIYANIKKFVSFLLSCNVGEVLIVFIAMLFNLPVPLQPIQLLWLNLVTDSFPALALGMEKGDDDIMEQPPRDPKESIIDDHVKITVAIQAIAITVATLTAYIVGLKVFFPDNINGARTMAFTTLVFAELLRSFSVRSDKFTVAHIGLFSNSFMVKAFLLSAALMMIVIYVPFLEPIFETEFMTLQHWAVMLPCSFLPFLVGEISKIIRFGIDGKKK